MKQQYDSPIVLVKTFLDRDVITASIQDDAEGFSLDWIAG